MPPTREQVLLQPGVDRVAVGPDRPPDLVVLWTRIDSRVRGGGSARATLDSPHRAGLQAEFRNGPRHAETAGEQGSERDRAGSVVLQRRRLRAASFLFPPCCSNTGSLLDIASSAKLKYLLNNLRVQTNFDTFDTRKCLFWHSYKY